ncbi:MAG: glycosyltransferase family 2 protein [Thermoleophilia bacterium]
MRPAAAASAVAFAPWLAWWGTWLAAALAGRRPLASPPAEPPPGGPRLDVLIPAHDEEEGLPGLLASLGIGEPGSPLGRVLVVADHCSDRTAEVARAAGARVLERDSGPRGKPAALRDGLAALAADGAPEAVMFLDADCACSPGLAGRVAARLGDGATAVQAPYTIEGGDDGGAASGVALGVFLRNILRPTGLDRMGVPVIITGSGFALAGPALDHLTFEDHLAEDLRLTHVLLERGIPVRLVPGATVTSPLPPDDDALTVQRARWEGGVLATWRTLPRLAARLALRGDARGVAGLVDASAPPLALAAAGWLAATAALGGAVAAGAAPRSALAWPAAAGGALVAYLGVGVAAHARWSGERPAAALARTARAVPRFVLWKAAVYSGMARPGADRPGWVRTPRRSGGGPPIRG